MACACVYDSKVVLLPRSRNEFEVQLKDNKYTKCLNKCERTLNKFNVPFEELYIKQQQQQQLQKTSYVKVSDNKRQALLYANIEREVFQNIHNHINNIERFMKRELTEQKRNFNIKVYNRLIECENEIKSELHGELINNKEILCALHNIVNDSEKVLQAYININNKNEQLQLNNEILETQIHNENARECKIKNNITYYKVNLRKITALSNQLLTNNNNNNTHYHSSSNKHNNMQHELTISCYNNNNNNKYNTVNRSTPLGEYMLPTNATSETTFTNTSERMKYRCRNIYNKTNVLNVEKRKFVQKEEKGKEYTQPGLVYNKVLNYIELAKEKYLNNNKQFTLIYKKSDLFSCDRKIVNDEGFRRLFLDMLVNDQDVQRTVDDNLIMTITQTKNVLNTNNNSIVNTMRSLSSN